MVLGCTLAFKVRVQPQNRNAPIVKASANLDIIALIKDQFQNNEVIIANGCKWLMMDCLVI